MDQTKIIQRVYAEVNNYCAQTGHTSVRRDAILEYLTLDNDEMEVYIPYLEQSLPTVLRPRPVVID